jgi:biotin carboxylase
VRRRLPPSVAVSPPARARLGRRLALVQRPRPFSVLALTAAAHGVCDLVWVIDTSLPEVAEVARPLRRFGSVVDVAGLPLADAAARIEAERPDGILALADSTLPWTAQIAERLGLPSVTPQVARWLTDKDAQRTALRAAGVPVPAFSRVPDRADDDAWSALARDATFPAVLKPRRGDSGRGVVPVRSLEEVRSIVASREPGVPSAELMLEEFLSDRPGGGTRAFADVVSVESVVSAARLSPVAVTGRFPFAAPFRETGSFIPSALGRDERDAVLDAAAAAIAALEIEVGVQHTEIKLTPDGPRVIEVNGRVGAGVPDLLAAVADVDLLQVAMRVALGEEIAFDVLPRCAQVAYVLLPQAPISMRRITAVEGLDRLRAMPGVGRVILHRGPGERVDWRDGYWGHVFSVEGVVADHEQLAILARTVESEVRIRGE